MRESLRAGLIDHDTICAALMTARGDLFLAASYLGCTGRELDSYIRASDELQGYVAAITTVKQDSDYKRMSVAQFEEQLENLTRGYRLEGLDVIHEIATMPLTTPPTQDAFGNITPAGTISAAMVDVKLKAAIQLRGAAGSADAGSAEHNLILQELNQAYQQAAPRIKSIRAVQIEYETPSYGHEILDR